MHDNEQYFFEALKAGASGYVLKSVANRDLIEACRARCAASRSCTRPPCGRWCATTSTASERGETTPEDPLRPRELEVVKLIAEGFTSEEIGEQLFISKKNGGPPPRERAGEARHAQPRRAHALRDPARPRNALNGAFLPSGWAVRPMVAA